MARKTAPLALPALWCAAITVFVLGLFVVGLIVRAAPLANRGGRLLWQFPTEDGYITLTIARNMALGKGMSTADGTMPTNGTQPLCTFLWSLAYRAVGGDKVAGVAAVLVLSIIIGVLTAWALFRLGRRVLDDDPRATAAAALAAAIWFASPLSLPHTMNGLETCANALLVLLCVHAFIAPSRDARGHWSFARCFGMGALFGVAFWVRNDACLLVLAACAARSLQELPAGWLVVRRRVMETLVMGATALAVACPWLIYNYTHFGSIVPTSGIAESSFSRLGKNLPVVPIRLCEYALGLTSFHRAIAVERVAILMCTLLVLMMAVVVVRFVVRKGSPIARTFLWIVGGYALALGAFYGVYFAAGYFLDRFLFPLSVFFALLWARAALRAWDFLNERRLVWLAGVAMLAVFAVVVVLHVKAYRLGTLHLYSQNVNWVQTNVPDDVWVAAMQSGTLGYFHDRTINLDGKVNPEALRARLRNRLPRYAVSTEAQYIVDWVDLAQYINVPMVRQHFILEVRDPFLNLAVFKRRAKGGSP